MGFNASYIGELALDTNLASASNADRFKITGKRINFIRSIMALDYNGKELQPVPCSSKERKRGRNMQSPLAKPSGTSKKAGKRLNWDDGCMNYASIPTAAKKVVEQRGCYADGTAFTQAEIELAIVYLALFGRVDPDVSMATYDDAWNTYHTDVLKRLKSGKLSKGRTYTSMVEALEKLELIEVRRECRPGKQTYGYRLAQNFYHMLDDGSLIPTNRTEVQLKYKFQLKPTSIKAAGEIETALTEAYAHYILPTEAEVRTMAQELANRAATTLIKGRIPLYIRTDARKKSHDYWIGVNEGRRQRGKPTYRILDDDIEAYQRLLQKGAEIPYTPRNFPRISDSFAPLPKWIREMVKIDGEESAELDFTSLHPQLLYGVFRPCLPPSERDFFESSLSIDGDVHLGVAKALMDMYPEDYANRDVSDVRREVKMEHLSFFNKSWERIMDSRLYPVYGKMDMFCKLLRATKEYVTKFDETYHGTHDILFRLEVNLMTRVVRFLYRNGIPFIYVYDAVHVPKSKARHVRTAMNIIARRCGLLATVK